MRVAVLVPFRDEPAQNRAYHLKTFLAAMPDILDAAVGAGNWMIFVGVQPADGHKFARGRILNALFKVAQRNLPDMGRIVLHDVDLIPDVARARGYCLRTPTEIKIMALNTTGEYAGMTNYIGGICAMDPAAFMEINGFPNQMEGWGGEDDALRDRISKQAIAIYTAGSVRNLETECDKGEFTRAKDWEYYKMPKEERRRIRQLWREGDRSVTGCQELVFSAKEVADQPPMVRMFILDVFDWVSQTSRSTGKTFFVHTPTGKSQWLPPFI